MKEPNFDSRPVTNEEINPQRGTSNPERKDIVGKSEAEEAVTRVGLILEHKNCEVAPFTVVKKGEPTAQGIACVNLETMFKSPDVSDEGRVEMLVADLEGTIASARYVELRRNKVKNPTELHASGEIATFLRGQGYATGSELAFLKTMQHIADNRNIVVRWTIANANLEEQHELEEKLRKAKGEETATLQAQIQAKMIEQEAWQSLYGVGGKLGMEVIGQDKFGDVVGRVFTPNTPAETFLNETSTTPLAFPDNPESRMQNRQTGKTLLAQVKQQTGIKEMRF